MSWSQVITLLACAGVLSLALVFLVSVRRNRRELADFRRGTDSLHKEIQHLRSELRDLAERLDQPVAQDQPSDYLITTANGRPGTADTEPASTSRVVSATVGEPLVKVAAFSSGVRQALREEKRAHLAYQVRREYRRRRRASRAAARQRR